MTALPRKPDTAPQDFPHLHDIEQFYSRLRVAAAKLPGYELEELGSIDDHPIYLLRPEQIDTDKPGILSAGGFHGDEAPGAWGILEYIEDGDVELMQAVNHAFLPLVNPTGFANRTRLNVYGENPNRGFVAVPPQAEAHATGNNRLPSLEGRVLMENFDRLLELARDGFVTQHEDWRLKDGFVFVNQRREMPSPFAETLRDTIAEFFSMVPDGGTEFLENVPVENGIWHNDEDSSFECLMHYRGPARVATTETPGQAKASRRVACNKALARAFARFFADGRHLG